MLGQDALATRGLEARDTVGEARCHGGALSAAMPPATEGSPVRSEP